MMKNYLSFFVFLISCAAFSQIIGDQAPYVLTTSELKTWTQNGSTADPGLIATVPLADRFVNTDTQFNPALSNESRIAYLPDGMNNFGNYSGEQDQFNLYNFTHWSYIDKLVWFGGTADLPILIPSAPWVNTAHKNGVEVLGNLFFAPNAFGGSTAKIQDFLEQDGNGDFIALPIMVEIMEYYNFDGWFINEETNTNAATAQLVYEFVRDLTAEVEALGKTVMWYDAMLLSGTVDWQDRLNANNSPFVQNDEDGDASNGFERRVSSNIFINFFWGGTPPPTASRERAVEIGRSEFDVFTGVDVWPGRNQGPFETAGNAWMGWLHETQEIPYTSLGLFAPNCVYNNDQYSVFNTDPNDYFNFYNEERHMFAGADRNPGVEDASGFKGYANWIPAASTITEMPFETNFNTGHGLKKFTEGTETSTDPWHNMDDQDLLPSWQFAFSENGQFTGTWDFDNAFNGGSSIKVDGALAASDPVDLLLYKTNILLTEDSKIDIVYHYDLPEDSELKVILSFVDSPGEQVAFNVSPFGNTGWLENTRLLDAFAGRELATIGLRYIAPSEIPNYSMNIGNIKVHEGPPLSINDHIALEDALVISYPVSDEIWIQSTQSNETPIYFSVYNLQGQRLSSNEMTTNVYRLQTSHLPQGMYLIQFEDSFGRIATKKILIQ